MQSIVSIFRTCCLLYVAKPQATKMFTESLKLKELKNQNI